jgi:hypothetical protein
MPGVNPIIMAVTVMKSVTPPTRPEPELGEIERKLRVLLLTVAVQSNCPPPEFMMPMS